MPRVKKYKSNISKNRKGQYPTLREQQRLHSVRNAHNKKVTKNAVDTWAGKFLHG